LNCRFDANLHTRENERVLKEVTLMSEKDDETLKMEIDEIMSTVDTIMEKVARVIPEDKPETDGQR
jgi:hypothetical protein